MSAPVYLDPGQFVLGQAHNRIYGTILGSCVSVIFWHPEKCFYAMCHYVMANQPRATGVSYMDVGRYGELILPHLLRQFDNTKLSRDCLEVSLFGGASSDAARRLGRHFQVAANNISFADNFINQQGLNLVARDLGGGFGRKIMFNTRTGSCHLSHLAEAMK